MHETVWGGNLLSKYKGIETLESPIGESWEVSAVPSSTSIVANGSCQGRDLISVIEDNPEAILGKAVSKQYDGKLPLLVKFIDAKRDLSIQVHPNDNMAKRIHNKLGKTEMWYILSAKPGSYLYCGFNKRITKEEYKRRVEDGTITEVLAKHEVKSGDAFYIPAGRVHAICGGIMLAEIQQASDLTYRIFDYNRPGIDGKPRELHTELAAEALDFNTADNYRIQYADIPNQFNIVVDSPYFCVREAQLTGHLHCDMTGKDSFIICMAVEGDCKIRIHASADEILLGEGHSCLIPASIANYDIFPTKDYSRVIDAFIDSKKG